MEIRGKKGDMSIDTVVMFIVIILGFSVILYFIVHLAFTSNADKQVCHESVILRATLPAIAGVKQAAPLKCTTEKICITANIFGKGDCSEYNTSTAVTTVRVSDVHGIEKAIAENIISCWQMMGEGKVGIFSQWIPERYGIGQVYPTCVVCNRIAFDYKSLEAKGIDLKAINVLEYMQTRIMPGQTISYADYLIKDNGKASFKPGAAGNVYLPLSDPEAATTQNPVKTATLPLNPSGSGAVTEDMSRQEMAIVFMQIMSPTHGESITNVFSDGLGLTAGMFLLAPGLSTAAAKAGGEACVDAWPVCAALAAIGIIYQQANVYWNRQITAGYCGDVTMSDGAKNGCSVVRATDYKLDDIKQYCSVIESIP